MDKLDQTYIAGVLERVKAGDAVRNSFIPGDILDSWRRCFRRFGGSEPDLADNDAPKKQLSHDDELARNALPVMSEYCGYIAGAGGALLLCDKDGEVLHIAGEMAFLEAAGIGRGVNLSENFAGTTAISLCMHSAKPAALPGAAHYAASLQGLAASAAPLTGGKFRFLGTLCAVFPLHAWNDLFSGFLLSLAANINNRHHVHDLLKDQETMLEILPGGVLILNREGNIKAANAHARHLLRISGDETIALGHISNFVKAGSPFLEILANGRKVEDEEYPLEAGHEKKRILLSASFIPEDKGIVCSLAAMERMERIVARSTGGKAVYRFSDILGNSEGVARAVEMARMAAQSDITTLILGESGTGKELFAHAIHNGSSRKKGPFITVNCGALPRELVQSELFGYEGGAFTGAAKSGKAGKFELANNGTIFLDEIGEMPLDAQTNLLRLIQNREVSRIGSAATKAVDVRIIAATNKNLQHAMETGSFRSDLYYRLCVFIINVPGLRCRQNDIGFLANHFLKRYSASLGKDIQGFTPEAMHALENYSWPGNIRELENVVEYVVNISDSPYIHIDALPAAVTGVQGHASVQAAPEERALEEPPTLYQLERSTIIDVLKRFNGNMSVAAQELGIARSALYSKLARFGIDHRKFRPRRK